MEQKIKLSIDKTTLNLLKKDCLDFNVVKENGIENFNAFLNLITVNFYEEFSSAQEKLQEDIAKALSVLPEVYKEKVFNDVIKILNKKETPPEKTNSVTLSFKPTKSSEQAVMFIENSLLSNESLSSFYRRMFTAYSIKTKNEREKIVRKQVYELLIKAKTKKLCACISLKSGRVLKKASVYAVAPAKDELYNYALVYDGNKNVTLRLSNIKCAHLTHVSANIPELNAGYFDRQIECGAQYSITSTDCENIVVKLTEHGKRLFEKIYLYRPKPLSVNGDEYIFNCSYAQVIYYFERFGEDALILSPKALALEMKAYYQKAYFAYAKDYETE